MNEFDDIVQEFLVESYENLDLLDRDLIALEQDPAARERLASIFRTIHTIKGTSGFLAFHRLEQLTHAGESLLSRLRDGTQVLDRPATDVLLRMIDVVRELLGQIERDGTEGSIAIQAVIDDIQACIAGEAPAAAPAPEEPSTPAPEEPPAPAAKAPAKRTTRRTTKPATTRTRKTATKPKPDAAAVPEATAAETTASAVTAPDATATEAADAGTAAADAAVPEPTVPEPAPEGDGASKRSVADSSIRVDIDVLDRLMRLVGELVLTRNQMVRAAESANEQTLTRTAQRLNIITSELQEGVMKTRMQPIKNIWSKLPRVVRDLSKTCGREVELVMEGQETELDRSLLEAVKDPLTHLVRNAVDHGIEPPEKRLEVGKDRQGTLKLSAYHEHGQVIVDVTDDGAGIEPGKVGATAVKRGVVTQSQLDAMDEEEILKLVFRPGFSTAATVSNVSGRGVGMDVVRTNLETIGGAVDLKSTPGKGTTWRLTIPLTLAIVQALIVENSDQRYVIPQMAVHELVYVDGQAGSRVEYVSGAPVYRLRGRLLPLIRLTAALGGAEGGKDQDIYVAVLKADGMQFGLVVDRVLNTEEVVVKPLATRFKDVGCYAGATILGDGQVALILDVTAVARRSHLSTLDRAAAKAAGPAEVNTDNGGRERLLITKVADRRVAIPLNMVTRLEEFPISAVERVGSREVVQYRGQILPVLRLAQLLGAWSGDDQDTLPAIVYTAGGRSVALAVDAILDIVSDAAPHSDLNDNGLDGSTVIHEKVTELLDIRQAILAADSGFFLDDQPGEAQVSPYLLEV